MVKQSLIQFHVDSKLKQDVSDIYKSLGSELPTALRMFLIKSKQARGLPFEATLSEDVITRAEASEAFRALLNGANGKERGI